jgi:hypothetical protein
VEVEPDQGGDAEAAKNDGGAVEDTIKAEGNNDGVDADVA